MRALAIVISLQDALERTNSAKHFFRRLPFGGAPLAGHLVERGELLGIGQRQAGSQPRLRDRYLVLPFPLFPMGGKDFIDRARRLQPEIGSGLPRRTPAT